MIALFGVTLICWGAVAVQPAADEPSATQPVAAASQPEVPPLPWEASIGAAVSKAASDGRFAAVYFYNDWCRFHRQISDECFVDPEVRHGLERFVLARLNAEEDRAALRRYGVRRTPTILFLDGDGAIVDEMIGYYPPQEYALQLRHHAEYLYDRPGFLKRLEANPDDYEALCVLAMLHAERREFVEAAKLLEKIEALQSPVRDERLYRLYMSMLPHSEELRDRELHARWLNAAIASATTPRDEGRARLDLGLMSVKRRDIDEAMAIFQMVAEMDGIPDAMRERALKYVERTKQNKEKIEAQEAEELLHEPPPDGIGPLQ